VPPKSISKDDNQTQEDTRILVNSLIELSKTMPEIKSQALESNEKIKVALAENDFTTNDIKSSNSSL
jgi:rRNA maturation endonuclease Nob1